MSNHPAALRLRAAYAQHGTPPAECHDHVADYAARLVALAASTATHAIRDSQGRRWLVTKLSCNQYILSGPRYAECRSAREAADLMEAE